MTISGNANYFNGKAVIDFESKKGIQFPGKVYRIRADYDESDGKTVELIEKYCTDPKASQMEELVIGIWDYESGDVSCVLEKLLEHKDKLQQLKHLFLGDITYEETEMSWIENGDVVPLIHALPNLVQFRVRGGNSLSFKGLKHDKLKKLIVETGGLDGGVTKQILEADLPNLEYLEIWLGIENYGFSGSAKDYKALFDGELFPKLKYLGLVNSEIQNEIAEALKGAKILERIEILDLSKGTLSDSGGGALLNNPLLKKLKFIDLHHHYMSNEMVKELKNKFDDNIDLSEQMDEEDPEDRYVEVSE